MMNSCDTNITLHGTMLNVDNIGVLLIGKAGSGKTEIALEMLTRRHRLVSDDAVKFERTVDNKLLAHKANTQAHQLHLRSIGIIDAPQLFDNALFCLNSLVDLVIQLTSAPDETASLFPPKQAKTILGIDLPMFSLYCERHCPLSIILETLVKQFKLTHRPSLQQRIAS